MDKRKLGNLTVSEIGMGCMGFSHGYGEIRKNIAANQPFIELVSDMAKRKNATNAQISLAWMLHKYPHVVPIPGSKNKERILENLGACNIKLTDEEFAELENALAGLTVYGHRRDVNMGSEYMD